MGKREYGFIVATLSIISKLQFEYDNQVIAKEIYEAMLYDQKESYLDAVAEDESIKINWLELRR